jgi:hypothetical protein
VSSSYFCETAQLHGENCDEIRPDNRESQVFRAQVGCGCDSDDGGRAGACADTEAESENAGSGQAYCRCEGHYDYYGTFVLEIGISQDWVRAEDFRNDQNY